MFVFSAMSTFVDLFILQVFIFIFIIYFFYSKSNAELLYAHITDNMTHSPYYYFSYAESILKTQGTSHISVIDKDNNMVSVTR